MKLSSLAIPFALIVSVQSFANDAQNEQPKCGIPYDLAGWRIERQDTYIPGNKTLPIGNDVAPGDVLMYANFKDGKRIYSSPDEVLLKDKSPLTPNSKINAGDVVSVVGKITRINDGTSYDLIDVPGKIFNKIFPVKPDGFICANQIGESADRSIKSIGMPVVFQASPLSQKVEEFQGGNTRSVAIVFQRLDGATIHVQATLMVNGQQIKTISKGFDAFSGAIDLSGLSFQIKKNGGNVTLISASEPTNYYAWISRYFSGPI